jgi:tRNA dimethylallyltransferase
MSKPRILAVCGPTASGKTALSIELAKRHNGEIISCDSMQIYRGMDIGTAKPTEEEKCGIPHHLIDIVDPSEPFSAADYAPLAKAAIADILSRGKLPIVCGGTGLYLDALLFERPFDECGGRSEVRERLEREAEEFGAHALHLRLQEVDPESAERIHENNVRRVIRALEIFETTGKKKSELDALESPAKYDFRAFELRRTDMDERYARIGARVDEMIACGLLDETKKLLEMGIFEKNPTAAQAIGYKEILGYVRGEMSLADARERLCIATRQYAKRQVTWFGAKKYIETVELRPDLPDPTDTLCARIAEWLEK